MPISLSIEDSKGDTKALSINEKNASLIYDARYREGDKIRVSSDKQTLALLQLEDTLPPSFGFLSGSFAFPVPFGAEKSAYSPKSFSGNLHSLWVKTAQPHDIELYRNLALNPYDFHENRNFFPHAQANVETRGEAGFTARNAINGNRVSGGHGQWPYESWGIGKRDDATLTISFGRLVLIDRLVVTLRADFPHDNWWKAATFDFSDGSSEAIELKKSGEPQVFSIAPRTVEWIALNSMVKEELDASPFPALIQLECWGTEALI
jgi:hypothetical protein